MVGVGVGSLGCGATGGGIVVGDVLAVSLLCFRGFWQGVPLCNAVAGANFSDALGLRGPKRAWETSRSTLLYHPQSFAPCALEPRSPWRKGSVL
jgi:hypothetical protein